MASPQQVHPERQKRVDTASKFFTIAATTTGVVLDLLHLRVGLAYIIGMEMPDWATLIAQAHGLAYMVYLLSILNLAPNARWSVGQWFTTALAGVIPFFSFWMEIKRRDQVKAMFQL